MPPLMDRAEMRGTTAGAHPGSVTWHGAAGQAPPAEGGAVPGRPHSDGRDPGRLTLALAEATVNAIESVGGYAGGVYMRSGTPHLLRLALMAGLPASIFRPWWRMHVNRPLPVAEAHRSGLPVLLADAEEAMRRFPQLMASLPFPFSSLYAPVAAGDDKFGVLVVLRPATPGTPVTAADRRRMTEAGARLGTALAEVRATEPVVWDDEPVSIQLPSISTPPVRIGYFDWDLSTGAVTPDDGLCAILGTDPDHFDGTIEALASRMAPEDAYGLWAVARQSAESGRPATRRMRLRGPDGRPHLLEISARADPPGAGPGRRLTGFLVDLGTGPVAEAGDRVPRAILALDRLGRITYLNRTTEQLLEQPSADLMGRLLWDAVPLFGHPAHEEHLRAALLTDKPVHFMARRAPQKWLSVSIYPGHDGLTVLFAETENPTYAPGSVVHPSASLGSPADRATALYRPVALAIALTEAVTARQVSAVVTEELLPAFGGRQLAIYLLKERHLHLAWETGFPQGFLNRFEGVSLDARLPGVETLTAGRPIFFESMEHLASAYPGIPMDANSGARAFLPLIASGRPVGSCILGFDRPRGFSPEERTVLTALAGLIAQALQRATRYDTEVALARGLQDALLPHRLPVREGVDTVGRYLPGTQGMDVGGDWYDVVVTGGGLLALVIGDVQGHGVAAAATMGQLRSAVRAFALSGHDPQEVLQGTNRLLIDLDPGQIASCCYIVMDPATGHTQAVRAGHPQPLLRHPDGRTEVLELDGGVVLGVDDEASYPVTEMDLEPGAVLALFTDGLVERPGSDIDRGVERLSRSLSAIGPESLAETADRLIRDARRTTDRPDDIALLLAARRAEGS
ncbi:diguanylate cyclase [Streptomyces purpureus]|uniref:protein-serine/threonine phosphatase n=2 Tax=Streptomyces purpureus TaxID=1951 RepID=A0A918GXM6_9ACTN|nr:diguanylate cyclase [Streptomyces purpureus]